MAAKQHNQRPSIFSLGFMTVWLTFWSVGVGLLSSMAVQGELFLWLFVFTHGGAQVFVSWLVASQFSALAERAVRTPEVELGLSDMTVRLRPLKARVWVLLMWCLGLGAVVGLLLGGGTWHPVIQEATPFRVVVASLMSVAWGVIGWRWLRALRSILRALQRTTVEATLDQVTVTRRLPLVEIVHELPAAQLTVEAKEFDLTLSSPQETVSLRCPPGPERDRIVETLNKMATRSAADPATQPQLPDALADMLGARRQPQGSAP